MLEDLLSDILNVPDEPDSLEGSQSDEICMIDSKKDANIYINVLSTLHDRLHCVC